MAQDSWRCRFAAPAAWLVLAVACPAQDLEPRRWSHLPLGSHFLGAGYAFTTGDIAVDPVLQLEDVTVDMHTAAMKYLYNLLLFNKLQKDDWRNQVTWALTLGLPLSRQVGLKFSYLGSRTLEDTGMDLDTVAAAISFMW